MSDEPTKEIAVRQTTGDALITQREWIDRWEEFGAFARVMSAVNQCLPEEAMAKILWGAEIGLPPGCSVNCVYKVGSKMSLSADAMVSIAKSDGWRFAIEHSDPPGQSCTVSADKEGEHPYSFTFTIDMAKAAGIYKKGGGWEKYPHDMLYARAASHVCRKVCGRLAGVYDKDEISTPINAATSTPLLGAPQAPPPPEEKKPLDLSDIENEANAYLESIDWIHRAYDEDEAPTWRGLRPKDHNAIVAKEEAFRAKVAEFVEASLAEGEGVGDGE
jgi:hypothetical protein